MEVPSYIRDKIDLVTDTTQEVCEKLAYKAHGHRYITGLWEAPAPAVVNPLTVEEVAQWDTQPLSIEFKTVTHKRVGRSGFKLSSRADWTERGIGNTFFGYKSDAPSSRLFKEDSPIGPVAKAMKAAGELAAVAEAEGEDASPVWTLVEKVWGVDVTGMKNYVMPDVSASSARDYIKFTRRTSHMLYGFDGNNTKCQVSLGHYRPDTISHDVYTDWHRISLSLRWIGEYISRYQFKGDTIMPGSTLLMAPVFREMPKVINCPIIPAGMTLLLPELKHQSNTEIVSLADYTMSYFKGIINDTEIRPYIQSASTFVRGGDKGDWDVESIRRLTVREVKRRNRLGLVIPNTVHVRSVEDLYPVKTKKRTSWKSINAMKFEHQISGVGALRLVLEAIYRGCLNRNNAQVMRSMLEWRLILATDSRIKVSDIMQQIRQVLPVDFGAMVFRLLLWGSNNKLKAEEEFLSIVEKICPNNPVFTTCTKTAVLFQAIEQTTSPDFFMRVLSRAIISAGDAVQAKSALNFRVMPGAGVSEVFLDGVDRYVRDKLKYWATQYGARCKTARLIIEGAGSREAKIEAKAMMITYSFLKTWYENVNVHFDKDQRVDLTWGNSWVRSFFKDAGSRYTSKRRRFNAHSEEVSAELKKLDRCTRIHDMAKIMDDMLNPKITYVSLYHLILDKTRVTRTSIEKTIRARLNDIREGFEDLNTEEAEEYEAVPDHIINSYVQEAFGLIDETGWAIPGFEDPVELVSDTGGLSAVTEEIPEVIWKPQIVPKNLGLFDMFDDMAAESSVDHVMNPHVNLKLELLDRYNINATIYDIAKSANIQEEEVEHFSIPYLDYDLKDYLERISKGLATTSTSKADDKADRDIM